MEIEIDDNVDENVGHSRLSSAQRFLIMIISSVFLALVLSCISIVIYYKTGSAQLDLSRPGYKDVRNQIVTKDDGLKDIAIIGPVDEAFLKEFKTLYQQQAEKAKLIEAFSGDPLDPNILWWEVLTSTLQD